MRLDKTIAVLAIAGALLALPAVTSAWATQQQPQQKSTGINQPARTMIQRAAARLQTNLAKDRVRRVQQRAMRDGKSVDGTASARAEPRLLSTGGDTTR